MTLKGLEPQRVWHHFELLSSWPRCSGACAPVLDRLEDLARTYGCATTRDAAGNLVIRKAASSGHQTAPAVILQAHVDMVCEQNRGRNHDFHNSGLKLIIDQGWVRADGTTLGADNGIGVAVILAILEDKALVHGPLEAVLTFDEETDMGGASRLDPSLLTGRTLLNLDGEGRGRFVIGTAGGQTTTSRLPMNKVPAKGQAWVLELSGLVGGHSGVEIHRQGGNSLVLLARFVAHVLAQNWGAELCLANFEGGDKDNAIPREAQVILTGPASVGPLLVEAALEAQRVWLGELGPGDSSLRLSVTPGTLPALVLTRESALRLLGVLECFPHGVLRMSLAVPGLVETSANLARVSVEGDHAVLLSSERSSLRSQLELTGKRVHSLIRLAGGESLTSGYFPPWSPRPESALASLAPRLWENLTGTPAVIELIHAGLECSLFAEKIPNLDMISFGAELVDIHTPRERVEIASVAEHYRYTVALLEALA